MPISLFSIYRAVASRHLHSFPTRRSSDLLPKLKYLILQNRLLLLVLLSTLPFILPLSRLFLLFFQKDRKSTRLNSSHVAISYAVFCLKKKNINIKHISDTYANYTQLISK